MYGCVSVCLCRLFVAALHLPPSSAHVVLDESESGVPSLSKFVRTVSLGLNRRGEECLLGSLGEGSGEGAEGPAGAEVQVCVCGVVFVVVCTGVHFAWICLRLCASEIVVVYVWVCVRVMVFFSVCVCARSPAARPPPLPPQWA